MHIAICDDNIADRKQLERLLQRESDRRQDGREPFYIDSYGNPDMLLSSPMLYQVFFIDMTSGQKNGCEIAAELRRLGVTMPIFLCISCINYGEMDLPENCFCLSKPIAPADLTNALQIAFEACDARIPRIELRTDEETLYVAEQDILYITADGRFSNVFLQDGKTLQVQSDLSNFFDGIKHFSSFVPASYETVVNIHFVSKITLLHVYTKNGCKFFLHPSFRSYMSEQFHALKSD